MLELDEQQNVLGLPDPRMYADTNGRVALLSDVTQYPSHSSLLLELSSSSSSSPSSAFQDVLTDEKGREKYVIFERGVREYFPLIFIQSSHSLHHVMFERGVREYFPLIFIQSYLTHFIT